MKSAARQYMGSQEESGGMGYALKWLADLGVVKNLPQTVGQGCGWLHCTHGHIAQVSLPALY